MRRPRGRTALLLALAAVLGTVGGTTAGYTIQADRAPEPLPPLNQPGLAYPAKPLPKGQEPEPLSASEDHQVKTDGDLRKLLLPTPKGARKDARLSGDEGWMDLPTYVASGSLFGILATDGLRRIAVTAWDEGEHRTTTIHLVQYRPGGKAMALHEVQAHVDNMPDAYDGAGNTGDPLNGSGNGRYYLYTSWEDADSRFHRARALFFRGDVVADINIYDSEPIDKDDISRLAERQLERL
ncbi:hypothetical protein ACIRNI_06560 [Streptomyces sp. NPDC093546]|uniref:hypothetical protein n=1 Tax=Streptomyces sp. NPDC093546 TaxID=3366040 RepID=UPI00380409B7